eukprot:7123417-Prymnesium_polylepis.1
MSRKAAHRSATLTYVPQCIRNLHTMLKRQNNSEGARCARALRRSRHPPHPTAAVLKPLALPRRGLQVLQVRSAGESKVETKTCGLRGCACERDTFARTNSGSAVVRESRHPAKYFHPSPPCCLLRWRARHNAAPSAVAKLPR